jgi:hypothetical protein
MQVNVIRFLTVADFEIDGETFAGGITRVPRAHFLQLETGASGMRWRESPDART